MFSYNIFNEITFLIVLVFLILTLGLGLYASRGIKTIQGYVLGPSNFSTPALILTLFATNIGGGSTIGTSSAVYSKGLIVLFSWIAIGLQYLFIALFIAPKKNELSGCLTMGDFMKKKFGKNIQIFTGFLVSLKGICTTSIQIFMLGKVFNYFFQINSMWGIIISGGILCVYSSLGGIRAITITDVLQFIVIIIAIPLIGNLLLNKVGGYKQMFSLIPEEKFSIFSNPEINNVIPYFIMLTFTFSNMLSPAVMQRFIMSANPQQAKNQFLMVGLLQVLFGLLITLIGLSIVVIYPNLDKSNILLYTVDKLFTNSIIKGIMISGFVAVIMSSADSFLNSTGVVLALDLIMPLKKSLKNKLLVTKLSTIIVGILAIIIALKFTKKTYFRNINYFAASFAYPTLLFPLIISILGVKSSKKDFVIGSFLGIVFLAISKYYFELPKITSILIGIFGNILGYIGSHLKRNNFNIILEKSETNHYSQNEKFSILSKNDFYKYLINVIPTPNKIYNFSRSSVMKYGANNVVFGIFCCINFTLPYFMWDHPSQYRYDVMIYLRLIGGILAGFCIVKDQWKETFKQYFHIFWHFTLIFCLPFVTTVMFFLTDGSFTWLFNIGISIFFLILLVDGIMFLFLAPIGIISGIIFYKLQFGPLSFFSLGFDINYHLIYQIIFPTIIGLLFAFRKKFFFLVRGNQGVNLGLSLCHELRNTGLLALPSAQVLNRKILKIYNEATDSKEKSYKMSELTFKSLIDMSSDIENLTKNTIKVVSTFENIFMEFKHSIANPGIYSMKSIITNVINEYGFAPDQKDSIVLDCQQDFYAKVPKAAFSYALSNIIRNAFNHGKASKITISLKNNRIYIRDNGIGIESSKLTEIYKLFFSTGDEHNRGVGLTFVKQLVESFFGDIWCESQQGRNSYTEFVIKFPEVSSGDISNMNLASVKEDAAKEGERKFAILIAKKMILKGANSTIIEELTNLTVSEIQEIRRKLNS